MRRFSLAFVLALSILMVMAAPVFAYLYRAPYTIAETSGNASYTALAVNASLDVDWLIANGFITTSTALDTRIETLGGAEQKHMVADDRVLAFVPSLEANSQINWYLTTGNTPLTSFPVITGHGGYVTITDHADLELANNFSVEFEGWVDTSQDIPLMYKSGALAAETVSGDLTAFIASTSTTTVTLKPDGAGDETNLSRTGGTANWEVVQDGSDATYVRTTSSAYVRDLYSLADSGFTSSRLIASVTVYFRIKSDQSTPSVYAKPHFKIGGVVYDGSEQTQGNSWTTKSQVFSTSPATGQAWTWDEINAMQLGVSLKISSTGGSCSRLDIVVSYYPPDKEVSVSGLSSGEYIVAVWADTTNFGIDIDGVTANSTALAGASVPPNSYNWTLSMPYFNYYSHTVNANHRIQYEPDSLIVGTTLPNELGASYPGAITWGSNPAGVTVTIGSLAAVPPTTPDTSDGDAYRDTLPETPVTNWFAEPDISTRLATNPIRPLVTIMSDTTTLTEVQAWRFLGLAILLLVVVVAATAVRGHLLIAGLAGAGTIGLLAHLTIWPVWALVFAIPAVIAGILAERTPSV